MGNIFNDVLGVSSAAKSQYRHQMSLQHDAQDFSKWQMANAHQTEVQDLQKAGLNPVLSAGGSGASAGVTEGGAQTGSPAMDPFSMIISAINASKSWEKTDSEINNINADTQLKNQTYLLTPELVKSMVKLNNATSGKNNAEAQKALQDVLESQVRQKAIELQNTMSQMDIDKRKEYFGKEMEAYRKQLQTQITSAGFESNQVYQAIDRAFATIGKVFSGSVSYNYGQSNSTSTSNVNVHNTDYNPERKAKIGF